MLSYMEFDHDLCLSYRSIGAWRKLGITYDGGKRAVKYTSSILVD